eukprot:1921282-Rhodomonas_salina.2
MLATVGTAGAGADTGHCWRVLEHPLLALQLVVAVPSSHKVTAVRACPVEVAKVPLDVAAILARDVDGLDGSHLYSAPALGKGLPDMRVPDPCAVLVEAPRTTQHPDPDALGGVVAAVNDADGEAATVPTVAALTQTAPTPAAPAPCETHNVSTHTLHKHSPASTYLSCSF